MKGTDTSQHSQSAAILEWLKAGKSITPAEAYQELKCLRLGARIYDLTKAGHAIKTEMVTVGITPAGRPVRVAQYSLQP